LNKQELEERESELVSAFFGERRTGFFVEVGANEPRHLSQTWHLEEKGWRGILVEPNPACAAELRRERPNSTVFQVACSSPEKAGEALFHFSSTSTLSGLERCVDDPGIVYERSETVKVMTLDAILESAGNPKIDFISIDVEGTELDVLKGFSLRKHRPTLLLVEDKVNNLQKHRHLKSQGYRLVRRTSLNNWYIPSDRPHRLTPWLERMELVRKMYLATPMRRLKLHVKRLRASRQGSDGNGA
jgi:FkbM family methyltransferase